MDESIKRVVDYIKKSKDRLITAASNSPDNMAKKTNDNN